jgi:hypothetical protein
MPFSRPNVRQEQSPTPKAVGLHGAFFPGLQNAYATYTLAIAAGADIVVTSDLAGVAGNALDFQATADGLAAATFDFSTVLTQLDSVLTFGTGGEGGNDWSVSVSAGSGGGEGVNVFEDTVNKTLTIMYETGVSTVTNVATAVATTTNFTCVGGTGANVLATPGDDLPLTSLTGGTPQEWAEQSGTPVKMHLHFTAAATTGTLGKNAINAVVGKSMTATGGDANAMAGGDAVAKQDLSGGVDAVASPRLTGPGGVNGDGTGTYTVTHTATPRDPALQARAVPGDACRPVLPNRGVQPSQPHDHRVRVGQERRGACGSDSGGGQHDRILRGIFQLRRLVEAARRRRCVADG